jgi:hypothetical protein
VDPTEGGYGGANPSGKISLSRNIDRVTYQKECICLALGVLIRRAAVFLVKSVNDRPKLVGTITVCRISPPSAQPEYVSPTQTSAAPMSMKAIPKAVMSVTAQQRY